MEFDTKEGNSNRMLDIVTQIDALTQQQTDLITCLTKLTFDDHTK
jgi:hypothetical protein